MVENQVSFRHVPHVEKGHNHVSTRAPGVVALSQLRHLSTYGIGTWCTWRARTRCAGGAACDPIACHLSAAPLSRVWSEECCVCLEPIHFHRDAVGSVSRWFCPRLPWHTHDGAGRDREILWEALAVLRKVKQGLCVFAPAALERSASGSAELVPCAAWRLRAPHR